MPDDVDANLEALLRTPIFEPLDDSKVRAILSEPPFFPVTGLINSRWLPPPIRPSFILRSGAINHLSTEGKNTLFDSGIRSIFDLRSLKERAVEPDPDIDGITARWEPSTLDNDTTPEAQAQQQDPHNFSIMKMYLDMLQSHKAAFRSVLLHVRDHPDQPLLFHCTAGKDRTGILAALLLALAGADSKTIDHDYALTRLGTEPAREMLTKKLFRGKAIDLEDPLVKAYANMPSRIGGTRLDAMSQTLNALTEQYNGRVEDYVLSEMGFTMKDLETVRKNLTSQ